MPNRSPLPDLDLSPDDRPGELMAGPLTPDRPRIPIPDRPLGLQGRLDATLLENQNLSAQVRELEAELRRSSTTLVRLRGELRGALHDALTDPLTGLANRRAFELELGAVGAHADGSSPAHLALVDIDHFKRVNDVHGHDSGDEVLRIVAEIVRANVRRDGQVARLGGDEFGLLLPGASRSDTLGVATRLCELFACRPLVLHEHPAVSQRITLSIGVAARHAGDSGAQWCARADAALYRAKRRGRNRVVVARHLQIATRAEPPEASTAAPLPATNRG